MNLRRFVDFRRFDPAPNPKIDRKFRNRSNREAIMAYVKYLDASTADASVKPIFAAIEAELGVVPNIFRAMAHAPEMFRTFLDFNASLATIVLDPTLRELAYMKVSLMNACHYCFEHHRIAAEKLGVDPRKIDDLPHSLTSDVYDEIELDVLTFAENVTDDGEDDPERIERLRSKLGERGLVELTFIVALANLTNRFNLALDIELP